MCEALLKMLPRSGFKSLSQQFFERYMKALLTLGRFSDVCEQYACLKLNKLFLTSTLLAATLHDAQAQV
ncbi:hypothetical protein F441_20903 [Phytophthora nicotianae CJ01A1]|nr:hypothetical protein PPTG_18345 [Phytophthora nicotianae INRA-310]ETI32063.1 hypothetical protein F443_21046 [Phytophthora nicotianae P1569]ETK72447.1 hypothetical protein L915_20450 [Phytophthora nicotianae]ETP01933.1 hypothetical protein F441_20903 [Phytophthora nicotianae CJ01A1]ETL25903.1 hypothetical protein L916_20311 [Phytophthora nicotianae]ETL79112.1 hypothetical protein L917_20183 [Phytophthora nicotianae]